MTAQDIQCPVKVQPQAGQGTVHEERGTQRDDILDNILAFGAVLPEQHQPAERLPYHLVLFPRVCLLGPCGKDTGERKPGRYSVPRRKFATFTPRGWPYRL